MIAWEAIQKTLDWIEDNLAAEINMRQLSDIACLSEFYYQRLFSRLVGKTVFEYVKLRRLEKAADLLSSGKFKVIDAGLDAGFESHETFTRAFREAFGITPSQYRSGKRPLNHFHKPDLYMMYTLIDENVPLIAEGIVLEVCRKILDYPRFFKGLEEQCPTNSGIDIPGELWSRFEKVKSNITDLKLHGNGFGENFDGEQDGCFGYFAGAETEGADIQRGFAVRTMPQGEYIVCGFEAERFEILVTDALDKAIDYMHDVWLPNKNIGVYDGNFRELYYRDDWERHYMEIWFLVVGDVVHRKGQLETIGKVKSDNEKIEFYQMPDARIIGKSVMGQLKNYVSDPNMSKLRGEYANSHWKRELDTLPHLISDTYVAWGGNHNRKSDKFTYLLGVITPAGTPVPNGFEHIDLPGVTLAQALMGDSVNKAMKKFADFGYKTAFGKYPWNIELYFNSEDIGKHKFQWLIPCEAREDNLHESNQ